MMWWDTSWQPGEKLLKRPTKHDGGHGVTGPRIGQSVPQGAEEKEQLLSKTLVNYDKFDSFIQFTFSHNIRKFHTFLTLLHSHLAHPCGRETTGHWANASHALSRFPILIRLIRLTSTHHPLLEICWNVQHTITSPYIGHRHIIHWIHWLKYVEMVVPSGKLT